MSDYTEKNSNLIPQIDIPCFAWNSQAEQGFLFFKAKSLVSAYKFYYNSIKYFVANSLFILHRKFKVYVSLVADITCFFDKKCMFSCCNISHTITEQNKT